MKKIKTKGITLISLVVTIIVMLILAGITVNLVLNENNGIFGIAQRAEEENSKQTATEKINLKITNSQMSSWAKSQRMPTLQELADDFCEDNEIQYVTLESQKLASLEKIEVGENSSIFTKLKDYPYEFEINSSLQLASIDGIKIATNDASYEQLEARIAQLEAQLNGRCNPKLLATAVLPNSNATDRAAGTYYANSASFTKTTTNDFEQYLSYDETKGWTVLKSGNYLINFFCTQSYSAEGANVITNMIIDEMNILLGYDSPRASNIADNNVGNTTIYLEAGTTINFSGNVYATINWNTLQFKIYALFE